MPKSSLQLVDEFVDEGVPKKEPAHDDEEADLQRALVARLTVKGKIWEWLRTNMPTKSSGHAESPSLDAELALTDSETEFDEEAPEIHVGDHDEGQAGPNPGEQNEESQPQSSHVVHARINLEHMDSEATDASYLNQNIMQMEVQSMVTVPFLQDTSSVPQMTSPVIDLTMSHPVSTTIHAPLPTSTTTVTATTTTTSLPPPPPQPQQSTTYQILIRRIGELKQHMADLVQSNLALEERLDKHGSQLYKLENLNIPQQVSKAVDEIVTDAVDWAMQAPL
ncbi:hypothetical protein Tco_1549626 [Tanacetum coccineum]